MTDELLNPRPEHEASIDHVRRERLRYLKAVLDRSEPAREAIREEMARRGIEEPKLADVVDGLLLPWRKMYEAGHAGAGQLIVEELNPPP